MLIKKNQPEQHSDDVLSVITFKRCDTLFFSVLNATSIIFLTQGNKAGDNR